MIIKHDAEISIVNRVRQPDIIDPNQLANVLQEYKSLFDIMAEEDPGYR